jgi:uncharacterized protein (DUF1501 family)
MKRRDFIKNASLISATPFMIGGLSVVANSSPLIDNLATRFASEDRILILIQLVGGNDGLNTVIPLDQYDNLIKVRESIILKENLINKLTDTVGLHPVMTGMSNMWKEGKLAVIQNVGYPFQNFSHFRSTDIWTSASDADKYISSGWLGRYLNYLHPTFPEQYPNDDYTDPLSITVGSITSQTCQGPIFSMGISLNSSSNFVNLKANPNEEIPSGNYGQELNYVRTVISQTEKYIDVIQLAADRGNVNQSIWEGLNDNLSNQLRIVAQLLSGGIKTKIFVCSIGGFDTHAGQITNDGNSATGTHANLLSSLSNSVSAFQKQIEQYGIAEKVVGMTFSEFGRRIISNNSLGTDHGSAAPMFVFGNPVNPGIYGSNPVIPTNADASVNLEMEYDFRDLYSTILRDWFDLTDSKVNQIMYKNFNILPIFRQSSIKNNSTEIKNIRIYPNPASFKTNLTFFSKTGGINIELYDLKGIKVANIFNSYLQSGEHNIEINLNSISNGLYLIKIEDENGLSFTSKLIVSK